METSAGPDRMEGEPNGVPKLGKSRLTGRKIFLIVGTLVVFGIVVAYYEHRSRTYLVEWVVDGDTFGIQYYGRQQLVQLAGADAPEIHKNEPLAQEALKYLIERILHKKVWLEFLDPGNKRDYKGRLLCWAWIEGENLNESLIREGLARFSGAAEGRQRKYLVRLEAKAREQSRGLWAIRAVSSPAPAGG